MQLALQVPFSVACLQKALFYWLYSNDQKNAPYPNMQLIFGY